MTSKNRKKTVFQKRDIAVAWFECQMPSILRIQIELGMLSSVAMAIARGVTPRAGRATAEASVEGVDRGVDAPMPGAGDDRSRSAAGSSMGPRINARAAQIDPGQPA